MGIPKAVLFRLGGFSKYFCPPNNVTSCNVLSNSDEGLLYFSFDNLPIIEKSEDNQIPDVTHIPLTPLTPFSLTFEAVVPRKQRKTRESSVDTFSLISSVDSLSLSSRASSPNCSFKHKRGRPKKKSLLGRPKKTLLDKTKSSTSSEQVHNVNFSLLPWLNYAREVSEDPTSICNRTAMRLLG